MSAKWLLPYQAYVVHARVFPESLLYTPGAVSKAALRIFAGVVFKLKLLCRCPKRR